MTIKFKHEDGTIDDVTMRTAPDDSTSAELRTGFGGCGDWPQESICNQDPPQSLMQIFTAQDMKSFWKASWGNQPEARQILD